MKIGDIVYLNSGSPPMQVQSLPDGDHPAAGIVMVTYANEGGDIVRQGFTADALTAAPRAPWPVALAKGDDRYAEFVASKKKPGEDIVAQMTPEKADALHMAAGAAGEGGELLDAIKRWTIYNKPLDRENVVEELGDLEFFMEGLRQRLGISREETLAANMAKLGVRYSGGYTDAEAAARADKQEGDGSAERAG